MERTLIRSRALPSGLNGFSNPCPVWPTCTLKRTQGGRFLTIDVNREEDSPVWINLGDVEDVIETAVGGENIGTVTEGPATISHSRSLWNRIGGQTSRTSNHSPFLSPGSRGEMRGRPQASRLAGETCPLMSHR